MQNRNELPCRNWRFFGVVKDEKIYIPEKKYALKKWKMTDIVELKRF